MSSFVFFFLTSLYSTAHPYWPVFFSEPDISFVLNDKWNWKIVEEGW